MIKSGLIFGAAAFVLILGSSILVSPLCAPCLGMILGLGAGYVAGIYDKPASSGEGVRKSGIAGGIAGSMGFLGGLVGAIVNGVLLNPSSLEMLYETFGLPKVAVDQTTIWAAQIAGGFCIGLFNIAWMAILGVVGGTLWYQVRGKYQTATMVPPLEPPIP